MAIKSRKLTSEDAAIIKALLAADWLQSDIASLFGCNSGRIAEISTGYTFGSIAAVDMQSEAGRARLGEVMVSWNLRMARQLDAVLNPRLIR